MRKSHSCQKYLNNLLNQNVPHNIVSDKESNCLAPFLKNKEISQVLDPIFHSDFNSNSNSNNSKYCKLISNKIYSKYIYTYDSSTFLNNFNENNDHAKNLYNVTDLNIYNRCCNCISIVLYALNSLTRYIYSIYFSVKNVAKYLPDWIVRLYIDVSVYELLMEKQNTHAHEYSIFLDTTNSPNVEIYTYVCPKLLASEYDNIDYYTNILHKTRFVRFLTFIDPSVKTAIVREADGIISASDCNNIKLFEQSDKIFYFAPFNTGRTLSDSFQNTKDSYSDWLNIYKSYIDKYFFQQYTNVYDLLAGLISTNIKIKQSVFNENILATQQEINNFVTNINIDNIIREKDYTLINRIHNIHNILSIGFDEIFLLRLFKNIISCKTSTTSNAHNFSYDSACKKIISDNTMGYHNIHHTVIHAKLFTITNTSHKNMVIRFNNFDEFLTRVKNNKITVKITVDDLLRSIELSSKTLQDSSKIISSKDKRMLNYYLDHLLNDIDINDLHIVLSVIIDFYLLYLNYGTMINYSVYLLIYPHDNFTVVHNNYSINFGDMLNNPINTTKLFYVVQDIYTVLNRILNKTNTTNYKRKIAKYQHKLALLTES